MGIVSDIHEAIAAAVADGVLPVVLLDIDSSLVSTAERHRRILVEFAEERGDPALIALAHATSTDDFGWSVDEPLIAAGMDDPALLRDLKRFWGGLFFSDATCGLDTPMPGAVAFVNGLADAGALVVYLTGRDARNMTHGTVGLLQRWGFPLLDGRAMLVLKQRGEDDRTYKVDAVERLARLGRVVMTVENEPGHANAFLARFPDAIHVLMDTVHSPTAPAPDPALRRLADFTG